MKPRLPFFIWLAVILALTGCATKDIETDTAPENILPTKFKAAISGSLPGSPSYQVEFQNNMLTYSVFRRSAPAEAIQYVPTWEQWKEFRHALYQQNVWNWQGAYNNPNVRDGTYWSIEIAYADRSVFVSGHNDYPTLSGKPGGQPEFTPAFEAYLTAVEKLLGNRTFR